MKNTKPTFWQWLPLYSLLLIGIITIGAIATVAISNADTNQPPPINNLAAQIVEAELRNEICLDPVPLGYVGKTFFQQAALINEIGLSGEVVDVAFVTAAQIQAEVVGSEFLTLAAREADLWLALLIAGGAQGSLEVRKSNIRGQVLEIWGAGTVTRSNLAAIQIRSASRAEALWGDGATPTTQAIEEALLALPC